MASKITVFRFSHCSEFCQYDLSKRDFRSAVDRLNTNVFHLCFTQVRKNTVSFCVVRREITDSFDPNYEAEP